MKFEIFNFKRVTSTNDVALNLIQENDKATSLRSAHLSSESPYKWFLKGRNNFFNPLIKGLTSDQINNPRQEFPDVFIPNGYVDILKSSFVEKNKKLHGDSMLVFETKPITEIDGPRDFEILELEAKLGHDLIDSLTQSKI